MLVLSVALMGCRTAAPPGADRADRAAPSLEAQYAQAVADARTAEAGEVIATLTVIAPHNESLVRRQAVTAQGDSATQVLVATWRSERPLPGPGQATAAGDTTTLSGVVWVTAAPAMRTFCRASGRTGDALDLRIAQRLGLPPEASATRFVEMWVNPANLARPCPDPEITDRICSLTPPGPEGLVTVDSSYTAWFASNRDATYDGTPAYPWTRLGYTYDWGRPDGGEVGVSEFIIRPGALVEVEQAVTTERYCERQGNGDI